MTKRTQAYYQAYNQCIWRKFESPFKEVKLLNIFRSSVQVVCLHFHVLYYEWLSIVYSIRYCLLFQYERHTRQTNVKFRVSTFRLNQGHLPLIYIQPTGANFWNELHVALLFKETTSRFWFGKTFKRILLDEQAQIDHYLGNEACKIHFAFAGTCYIFRQFVLYTCRNL